MSQQLSLNPTTIFDLNGHPVPLGSATFFLTGTTTPIVVYLDEDLSVVATQPVESDAAGRLPQLFAANGVTVKAVIKDASGTTLYTLDPVSLSQVTGTEAVNISFDPISGNAATNVQTAIANIQTQVDGLDSNDIDYTNTDFPLFTNVDLALDAAVLRTGKTITTEDLNTLTTAGLYLQMNATLVSLARNYPYAADANKGYFTIEVERFAHGGVSQRIFDGFTTYTRSLGLDPAVLLGSSSWTVWVQVADTGIFGPWSYAWHPHNKATLGDSATGIFYNSATDGAVATITTPTFVDGYEYRIVGANISPSTTAALRYELYRGTDAAYNTAFVFSASTLATGFVDFDIQIPSARVSTVTHITEYWAANQTGTNAAAVLANAVKVQNNFIVSQKIDNVRLSWSAGNIDNGVMRLYRRRINL